MKIKNYTSIVPVEKSIAEIERLLVQAGAQSITKIYTEKEIEGFSFLIPINGRPVWFQLPAKVERVQRVFLREQKFGNLPKAAIDKRIKRIREQGARTAWRILADWVHLQLSMIELDQVELLQVLLPYATDPATGQTFFERVKSEGFKLLTA